MLHPVAYVALVREDPPGDFLVTFPDVPEAISQGHTLAEAAANAADALDAALGEYLRRGRPWPERGKITPSQARAGVTAIDVAVAPALAARALLAAAMAAEGLSKAGLAQRMGRDEKVARRILAGQGASLDLTLEALRAMGVRAGLAA